MNSEKVRTGMGVWNISLQSNAKLLCHVVTCLDR